MTRIRSALAKAAALLLMCAVCGSKARAAGTGASLVIPVNVVFDELCPAGSAAEVLVWSSDDRRFSTPVRIPVSGSGTVYFGPADYDAPGSFHYHVKQQGGNVSVAYDSAEYEVTARVFNGSGGRLYVSPEYRRTGSAGKSAYIRFDNRGRAVLPASQGTVFHAPATQVPAAAPRFFPAATGDTAVPPGLLARLMCLSAAGLAALQWAGRQRCKGNKEGSRSGQSGSGMRKEH